MLKDDFYRIKQIDNKYSNYLILLELNEAHAIYKGHFPNQPVMPGACLLRIMVELAETVVIFKKVKLLKVTDIKFLIPINPLEDNSLTADMTWNNDNEGNIIITTCFFQKGFNNINCKCSAVFTNL